MSETRPYLSVVAAARNDDHGGNLLGRMQAFVEGLIGQARQHELALELVLVEWNPPPDRPRLAEALRWPADFGPVSVRIIEVPARVHAKYRYASVLPLYQMIAKNVGIRRARGEFVLATNVDILFSDELFRWLAARCLEPDRMYRVDRLDVMAEVPLEASVEERLAWCRTHLLRRHTRVGTVRLTPDGRPWPEAVDVADPGSGIVFGEGWFAPACHAGVVFRWAGSEAEIEAAPPDGRRSTLVMELEPGPGVGFRPFQMEILEESGAPLGEVQIPCRGELLLDGVFRGAGARRMRLRVRGGGQRVPYDTRVLNFRVFRCGWTKAAATGSAVSFLPSPKSISWERTGRFVKRMWHVTRRLASLPFELRRATESVRIGLPVPARVIDKLRLRLEGGGLTIALGPRPETPVSPPLPEPCGEPDVLHTNACGDFTLLARRHWLELRGYPEFDLHSMNVDSVFCYMAHYGGAREAVLPYPMCIYHIEHATGSGWTPEGEKQLFDRLARNGIPWLSYHEVAAWAAEMHRLGRPVIFNLEDWGLATECLPETFLPEARRAH